ncbi:MAG: YggT family protein [Acidimicrobiales bacterium]|jgi:YggT family protein
MILTLVILLLEFYVLVLIAYSVLSWVRPSYGSPVEKTQVLLARLCDPVLNRVRRVLPTARVGGVGIDLSVLVVIIVIEVVISLL